MDADVKGVFGVSHVPNNKFVGIQRMAILIHGQRIIDMIGSALSLLGPDSELIEEYLSTLGPRHLKYKIKASHFQSLGKALRDVIKGSLRESWTNSIDEAWKVVFDEMVSAITKPIIAPTTPLGTTSLIKSKTQRNPAA